MQEKSGSPHRMSLSRSLSVTSKMPGLVSRCEHLQVEVGGPPDVPAGCGDEPAAEAVRRDLVEGGLDGGDREAALGVGHDAAAQVPLRNAGRELRIQPFPQLRGPTRRGGAGRVVLEPTADGSRVLRGSWRSLPINAHPGRFRWSIVKVDPAGSGEGSRTRPQRISLPAGRDCTPETRGGASVAVAPGQTPYPRSTHPRIRAAGDVTGHPQVVHVAAGHGTRRRRHTDRKPS